MFIYLAKNPDDVNKPQTSQESYCQLWMDSFEQDPGTIIDFLDGCVGVKRPLQALFTSPSHIGVTKFALETCEMLVMSRITDWDWLGKSGATIGIEVCVIPVIESFGPNFL